MTTWLGKQRIDLEACGSTNDEAARFARAGASHGTVVIAGTQTGGRGREGRLWHSPTGGLYFSAIVRPPISVDLVPPMTLAIGIAVCDAIASCGVAGALKWPNDVLVGDRKIAGVLVETQSQGKRLESVVIGIGINITAVPAEIATIATSLEEHAPRIEREVVIGHLCTHLERWVDRYTAIGLASIVDAWHARMAPGIVARATVDHNGEVLGEVAGLDIDGALLLRDDTGALHRVRSGDVEVIRTPAVGTVRAASRRAVRPRARHK